MKMLAATTTALSLMLIGCAPAVDPGATPGPTSPDIRSVSPALERYKQDVVEGDLWQRPDLSPRDRSAVTLAALIARNQTVEMSHHLDLALENGLTAGEISEIITHLAFYAGWGNATTAVTAAEDVFARRGIETDQTWSPATAVS